MDEWLYIFLVVLGVLTIAGGIIRLDLPFIGAGVFLVAAGELADWRRRRG